MAAVTSSRQSPAHVQQLTPPSSAHGQGASWDFAVPVNHSVRTLLPPVGASHAAGRVPLCSHYCSRWSRRPVASLPPTIAVIYEHSTTLLQKPFMLIADTETVLRGRALHG